MPVKAALQFLFCASALAQGWGRNEMMSPWLEGRDIEAEQRFVLMMKQSPPEMQDMLLLWHADFDIEYGRFGRAAALITQASKAAGYGEGMFSERRLARLRCATGRFAEAWRIALEGHQWDGRDVRKLKVSSPMQLVTLGEVLLARGEFSEAIAVLEKARGKAKNVQDLDGFEWVRAQNGIAIANLGVGSVQTASEVAEFALSEAEREWGPASIPAVDVVDTIGLIRLFQSRLDEAEDLFSRSRIRREAIYGTRHPKTGESYRHAALLSAARKDSARAVSLITQGLDVERALAAVPNGRWALALLSGAELFAGTGRVEDAAGWYEEAIPVLELELGPGAPRLANARKQQSALAGR